ncbi:hypothetical protein QNN00_15995 [Bacillus velezensis]|nr:hypothetical protein [Bacillus velezensis]
MLFGAGRYAAEACITDEALTASAALSVLGKITPLRQKYGQTAP